MGKAEATSYSKYEPQGISCNLICILHYSKLRFSIHAGTRNSKLEIYIHA